MATHYSEDDLTLYYYGEGRRRDRVEQHLGDCAECQALYRRISGTLALIAIPEVPERGDQYGLEVWQRIRQRLPEQDAPFWAGWFRMDRLVWAAAAAALVIAAFVVGRQGAPGANPPAIVQTAPRVAALPGGAASGRPSDVHRILLASVADHLDRSERVLTDIMHAADSGDISTEQAWAEDLVTASRLYRQDAVDANEQSVAAMLDEIERNLLEIVHSPAKISAADLDEIRRRIDATALLFKVRVMSDELRQRGQAPADGSDAHTTRTPTRKTS